MSRVAAALAAGALLLAACGGSHRPVSTTSPPAPPPPPTAAPAQLGASVNLLFNPRQLDGTFINNQLAALQATGATLARSDALWEASEPTPPAGGVHRYDWRFDDLIAASLANHALRWLPIIDYSPSWAQSVAGQDHSAPRSDADYAAYAAAVADRYGPAGSFWREHPELPALPVQALEIWNEPDNAQFWAPAPDATRYAKLYAAARAAIHAAEPGIRVVVGGLSNVSSFLPAMVAGDPVVRGQIDAVAIHPYAATPAAVLARVGRARRVLDALGLSAVPLYVTEFGWTTSPRGALDWLPAARRPHYIGATLEALGRSGCRLAAATLYTWFSPRRDPANGQQWFGISASAPDVFAFAAGIRAAEQRAAPPEGC